MAFVLVVILYILQPSGDVEERTYRHNEAMSRENCVQIGAETVRAAARSDSIVVAAGFVCAPVGSAL